MRLSIVWALGEGLELSFLDPPSIVASLAAEGYVADWSCELDANAIHLASFRCADRSNLV